MKTPTYPELKIEDLDIKEYASDSAYEQYTGIVLDPEDQIFKTVSGSFHDKKDFYEKLSNRGYVVRKVFEKKVFDWIEENAKTTLEAYLMFSTAFSKWKGNNLLDSYYVKLLNDIPQLNREKIKGDPNSIGNSNSKEESVLDETYKDINIEGSENWGSHNVIVIPEDDEFNELEIPNVKFNPVFKRLANNYAKLNNEGGYRNSINQYLQTSPAFIRALGKEINPVNRDTAFRFYNPTKDNKSPLFIPGNKPNPIRFNIKIDGEYLKNLDGSNYVLTKGVILNWLNATGEKNYNIPQPDAVSVLKNQLWADKEDTNADLLKNAADFEKTMEIISQSEINNEKVKNAIETLVKNDIRRYIDNPPKDRIDSIPLDTYRKAKEFKRDLYTFVNPALTKDERKELYQKYDAETQAQAINNLKQKQNEFYEKAAKEIKIPDSIDDQIRWIEEYIQTVEHTDLSDNYTKLERLNSLRAGLEKLKYKKDHPNQIKATNKLQTNYASPATSPINATRTGWIKPQGAKAKHNISQDELRINQGIHGNKEKVLNTNKTAPVTYKSTNYNKNIKNDMGSAIENQLNDQIAVLKQKLSTLKSSYAKKQTENLIAELEARLQNKNESDWSTIVNSLKENHIPIVDDIVPGKHVNYNATVSYLNQPIDGVITNPGASFKTGGTFFAEEEQDNLDPQWDNRAHDTLNQDLFENTHLRPEVREALLRIANKFQSSLGLNIEPVDIYLTGSSANFNYNEMSDIDLHLVYDFEQIGINAEILVKYFIAKKQVFNNDYDITIKGIPVEVGVENLNEPIVSSAIYSVLNDRWMLQPKDAEHLLPKPDMKRYYELVQKIEDAIESRNSQKIGALWDELYRIRKDSLAHDGEYGHGNGMFKKLRNLGYLDRLKHAYYSSASEELSIESLKEII